MEIPVYLFTGFLEAGKTKFIQETLEDERFNSGTSTLLLLCEEGFTEYENKRFSGKNVFIETIENESDLTEEKIKNIISEHSVERIIVEYNGMWHLDSLYNNLPRECNVYQEIFFVDARTFLNYNNNMRSLVVDKLKSCELVVFNHTDENTDKEMYHKIVRATSRRTNIIFEYKDGRVEYDETEDPLPFDINEDVIVIKDEDFALWYRDISEDTKKYAGKTVKFKAIIAHNNELPKDTCLVGRHIMTCCIDDISYGGMLCIVPKGTMFHNKDWMMVTAKVKFENHELYQGKGPVLYAESLVHSPQPKELVATFY
ncbi:MAG: GTPase [Clostridia bacterium]|nr:GTPase [Clostridia bacterium]